jgi:hypothetical protein
MHSTELRRKIKDQDGTLSQTITGVCSRLREYASSRFHLQRQRPDIFICTHGEEGKCTVVGGCGSITRFKNASPWLIRTDINIHWRRIRLAGTRFHLYTRRDLMRAIEDLNLVPDISEALVRSITSDLSDSP